FEVKANAFEFCIEYRIFFADQRLRGRAKITVAYSVNSSFRGKRAQAMTTNASISARLSFNQIEDDTRKLLRENKDFIVGELHGVLESFYAHVVKYPETAAFFRSREMMTGAKNAQLRHWQTILDANFDATYEASIKRIGDTHHRIGLDPRWYIGGYNALL